MPLFNKLRSHRIASLALYRAFLRHTSHLPLPPHLTDHLSAHIRHQFRKKRNLLGLRFLRETFSAAYDLEKKFRAAATGDVDSLDEIASAIPSLPLPRLRPSPPPPPPPPAQATNEEGEEGGKKQKQRDKPSGRPRFPKPPHVIVSNQFPILRRPGVKTPLATSMVIKDKVRKRQERQNLEDQFVDWLDWAAEEDDFERSVERIAGVPVDERGGGGGSWADGARVMLRDLRGRMRASDRKSLALIKDFNAIIAKETEERDRKIVERKKAKNERHRQRRAERAAEGGYRDGDD